MRATLRHQPGIDGDIILARHQGDRGGDAGGLVRIGIRGRCAGPGRAEIVADGLDELHLVGAGRQVDEAVQAPGIRRRGAERGAAVGAEQVDGHAGDAGLAGILHAVVVGVGEHVIAQRGRSIQPGVDGDVVLPGNQGDRAGHAGGHIRVRVGGGGALPGRAEAVAARLDELHLVGADIEVAEGVMAVGIGGRGQPGEMPGAVQQPDGHAGHAGLAAILHAVVVGVLPHRVAQRGLGRQRGLVETLLDDAEIDRRRRHRVGIHRGGDHELHMQRGERGVRREIPGRHRAGGRWRRQVDGGLADQIVVGVVDILHANQRDAGARLSVDGKRLLQAVDAHSRRCGADIIGKSECGGRPRRQRARGK